MGVEIRSYIDNVLYYLLLTEVLRVDNTVILISSMVRQPATCNSVTLQTFLDILST